MNAAQSREYQIRRKRIAKKLLERLFIHDAKYAIRTNAGVVTEDGEDIVITALDNDGHTLGVTIRLLPSRVAKVKVSAPDGPRSVGTIMDETVDALAREDGGLEGIARDMEFFCPADGTLDTWKATRFLKRQVAMIEGYHKSVVRPLQEALAWQQEAIVALRDAVSILESRVPRYPIKGRVEKDETTH